MHSKEKTMRDAAINLRALPAQRDLIDRAATLLGKNRSDFMLEAACDKAQAVVLDQVFFSLNADKFQRCQPHVCSDGSGQPYLRLLRHGCRRCLAPDGNQLGAQEYA
jgi:uncharacterized protein (DUF1778 family)